MRKMIPALAAALLTAATIAPAAAETNVETKPAAPQEGHGAGGHEGDCCKMMHEMHQMHEQMMEHMKSMHQGGMHHGGQGGGHEHGGAPKAE